MQTVIARQIEKLGMIEFSGWRQRMTTELKGNLLIGARPLPDRHLVAGYCVVLFGWVAYTNLVNVRDFEGAASMLIAFFFAPLGGLLTGLVLAICWQKRKR